MNDFEQALARVNKEAAATNAAIADIRRQEKEAKAALESLAWEEKEQQRTKQRLLGQSSMLNHVVGGHCFAEVKSERSNWSRNSVQCDKPAQKVCEDCGAPVCGTHNRVSKYKSRAHNCAEWKAFKRTVIDGLPEERPFWQAAVEAINEQA